MGRERVGKLHQETERLNSTLTSSLGHILQSTEYSREGKIDDSDFGG